MLQLLIAHSAVADTAGSLALHDWLWIHKELMDRQTDCSIVPIIKDYVQRDDTESNELTKRRKLWRISSVALFIGIFQMEAMEANTSSAICMSLGLAGDEHT